MNDIQSKSIRFACRALPAVFAAPALICLDNDFIEIKSFCFLLGSLAVGVPLLFALLNRELRFNFGLETLAGFVFFALIGLSVLTSSSKYLSFLALGLWASYLIAWLMGAAMGRSQTASVRLFQTLGAVGLVLAAHAIVQRTGSDPLPVKNLLFDKGPTFRASSTFGNPAILADFLSPCLMIAIYLAWRPPGGRASRMFWVAAALAISTAVFITLSRTAILAVAVGIGVFALSAKTDLNPLSRFRPAKALLLACAVGALLAAAFAFSVSSMDAKTRIEFRNAKQNSQSQRLFIWRMTGEMIKERPLLGSGLDVFRLRYLDCQAKANRGEIATHLQLPPLAFEKARTAHNDYLQIASDSGAPALLAYLLFMASSLAAGFSGKKQTPEDVLCASMMATLAVCSFFSFPLRIAPTGGMMFLAAGRLASRRIFREPSPALSSGKRPFWFAAASLSALIGAAALIALFYARPYLAHRSILAAKSDISRRKFAKADAALDAAIRLDPHNGEANFLLGERAYQTGKLQKAIDYFEKAQETSEDPGLHINYGHALLKLEQPEKAAREFQIAVDMFPAYLPALQPLALAHYKAGALDDCLKTLDKIIDVQKKISLLGEDAQTVAFRELVLKELRNQSP